MRLCLIDTPDSLRDMTKYIAQYLWQHENMETDRLLLPNGEYVIQGQVRSKSIRKYLGMDKRIVITLRSEDNNRHSVWVSHPAIKDKFSVLSLSLVCLWPLLFSSLFGLFDQLALFCRLFHFIKTIC